MKEKKIVAVCPLCKTIYREESGEHKDGVGNILFVTSNEYPLQLCGKCGVSFDAEIALKHSDNNSSGLCATCDRRSTKRYCGAGILMSPRKKKCAYYKNS